MKKNQLQNSVSIAKKVITIEMESIEKMSTQLGETFNLAVEKIHQATHHSNARVVLSGIGKSGLIAQKISATLSSTGVASFYLHPVEASHGDLGMVKPEDIVIVLSHSGENDEILRLIPFIKQNNNFLIAISGNENSTLAKLSNCFLHSAITREACLHNLVPTSSTTCMLLMGDALSIALMEKNQFTPKDFAKFHPSGSLGKRLLTSVSEVMRTKIPRVNKADDMLEVVSQMSGGQAGCVLLFDFNQKLVGIITDGDLRRALEKYENEFIHLVAEDIATKNPLSIDAETKLEEAKDLMNQKQITCLVVEKDDKVVGLVQIFDCEI